MNLKTFVFCFVFIVSTGLTIAQRSIRFILENDSTVTAPVKLSATDSLSVLRFYISDLEVLQNRKVIWHDEFRHHLIDFSEGHINQLKLSLPKGTKGEELRFLLGVDSKTAEKGIGEGDLDPLNGMYWTWQSGYINFKMEGVSLKSPARKHRFQLHLGGFQKPFRAAQEVRLSINEQDVIVAFDLQKFISKISFKEQHTIMSPGEQAVTLSRLAKSCFYAQ